MMVRILLKSIVARQHQLEWEEEENNKQSTL
jgi:hypothetical protein